MTAAAALPRTTPVSWLAGPDEYGDRDFQQDQRIHRCSIETISSEGLEMGV